jgi:tRNA threonylcarbamoyladenosine biosynthesis protein TsaE
MSETFQFITASSEETIACGREMVRLLALPKFLVLRGELGAGKTTLVKGIAEGLNAASAEDVTSPTFTLIHEYEGSLDDEPVRLYHLDLYRIESERELATLGIDDLIGPESLVLVEWGEKFASILARADGEIFIEASGEDARVINLTLKG